MSELTNEQCAEIARQVFTAAPINPEFALIRAGYRAALARGPDANVARFWNAVRVALADFEQRAGIAAPPDAQEIPSLLARHTNHPDDAAVDRFATAMKIKMAEKRDEGRGGWDDKDQCTGTYLRQLLRGHVAKGDPVDVGNLAMMLWNRGEATQEPQCTCGKPRVTLHERGCPMAAQEQRSMDGSTEGRADSEGPVDGARAIADAQRGTTPEAGNAQGAGVESGPSTHQEPPASRQEDERRALAAALFKRSQELVGIAECSMTCGIAANAALARLAQAEKERDEAKEALIQFARDRTPAGKTMLDFYAVWLEQERDASRALRAENERLRAALIELVACKDLKERLDAQAGCLNHSQAWSGPGGRSHAEGMQEYERRKTLAWKAARALAGDANVEGSRQT